MKIKHLILLTTTAVAASSLSSCKEEPYIITAEEEYTRNFIKEFGLIDPKQDWNLAEGSTVTVKVGSTPAEVKAYMKVDNTYYLVADLRDVAGDVKIPFDMPEGTKDIMVKINGTRYYTTPGGTVDPSNVVSRADATEAPVSTGTYGGVTVTVTKTPRQLRLEKNTMTEALQKLPERTEKLTDWTDTNIGVVTDNFYAKASEFWLFPEFWNTNGYSSDEIGIYWYITEAEYNNDNSNAAKIDTEDKDGNYIRRAQIFSNPWNYVTMYLYEPTEISYQGKIPAEDWAKIWPALQAKYGIDSYYTKEEWGNITYWHLYRNDGQEREINDFYDGTEKYQDNGKEVCKDIAAVCEGIEDLNYTYLEYERWGTL